MHSQRAHSSYFCLQDSVPLDIFLDRYTEFSVLGKAEVRASVQVFWSIFMQANPLQEEVVHLAIDTLYIR
jgi:hypothetical protein